MKNNFPKILNTVAWVIVACAFIFQLKECGGYKNNYESLLKNNGSLQELVKNNQSELVRYKNNDVEQKQLILELNNKQSKMLIENDSLRKHIKRVESITNISTETNFTGIKVPLGNGQTIEIRRSDLKLFQQMLKINNGMDSLVKINVLAALNNLDSLLASSDSSGSFLKLPYSFSYNSNKWLSLNGAINKKELVFDTIRMKDSLRVLYYEKKQGFLGLGKPQPIVKITSENPYSTIKNVENVVVKPKQHIYQRKSFWTALGFLLGWFTFNKLAQ